MPIHEGRPDFDDVALRDEGIIRIYDIVFPYEVLLDTDAFFREILKAPEFQRPMSTAEFHFRVGGYVTEAARRVGIGRTSRFSPPRVRAAFRSTPARPATPRSG